MSSKRKIIFAK